MKNMFKITMAALLFFGLALSTASPQEIQDQELSEKIQQERNAEIKELTIRNSGFLSKSEIIIRYREEDKKIIDVIENGKKLPSSEFSRYESLIREVLEIPQIERLIPEIERAKRMTESARISEEAKIRELIELRARLEDLNSDRARRYRDINELLLMEEMKAMSEKISESEKLSEEEKIAQLQEMIAKLRAEELARGKEDQRRRLAELSTNDLAQRLIAEISRSNTISNERKIQELNKVLQSTRQIDAGRQDHRELIEIQVAEMMKKMMQEVLAQQELTDQDVKKELETLLQEAKKMELNTAQLRIEVEKFKFDLHQLLKAEGLLPEGKAQFELRANVCTIAGKRLPDRIHEKILKLCEECLSKKFDRDTKIVLTLNEERSWIRT